MADAMRGATKVSLLAPAACSGTCSSSQLLNASRLLINALWLVAAPAQQSLQADFCTVIVHNVSDFC